MPSRRILIVDDDAEVRAGIRDLVTQQGFIADCAKDGIEALASLRGPGTPSLIFLDLTMPGMSGWEFRRAQLSDPRFASIPVVVTTGHPDYGEDMVSLRADGHLQKPIRPEEVLGVLDRFSQNRTDSPKDIGRGPMDTCVLVVEDDPELLEALSGALESEGYGVGRARHGLDALGQLRAGKRPCLILLDLMMPIMNGWQFRHEQRQDSELSKIPVVVVSAKTDSAQHAAWLEADAYIEKPISLQTLLETVSRYCGGAHN